MLQYDNVVYSPPGKPDVVYLGGAYDYSIYGGRNNGRAFLRSSNAGVTFTDMTWDATTNPTPPGTCCQPNPIAPNGQHPDSHAIVEYLNTDSAIFGGDGGLTRSGELSRTSHLSVAPAVSAGRALQLVSSYYRRCQHTFIT